ncbi:MAG: EAL domain-containing protein [Myxococcales bacterium]|nr:MAG: EAL domain-containing protein [Myxococcales bacterium]
MEDRILLVDDEPAVLRSATRALAPLHLTIDTAALPSDALKQVAKHSYSVVAVDLDMPEMSGLELITKIQKKLPHATYMVVTGKLEVEPSTVFISDAVTSIVYKPWAPEELISGLEYAIKRYHQRRHSEKTKHVLLIEDNPTDIELVTKRLQATDWKGKLTSATSLTEAIQKLKLESFSAIVLDLSLSDADGLESVETLRHSHPGIPIVVLSGHEDEERAIKAVQSGAEDYLFKWEASGRSLVRSIGFAIERHSNSRRIAQLVHYDELTHLPKRKLFRNHLHRAISRARLNHTGVALLYLNMDRFHLLNEEKGYDVADAVLQTTADQIRLCIDIPDKLGKLGANEFGIACPGEKPAARALSVLEKIRTVRAQNKANDNGVHELPLSIGVALYPENGNTVDELLQYAEQAMHRGRAHRDRDNDVHVEFYSAETHARELCVQRMERDLRQALTRQEFDLVYQSQHRIANGALVGAEALLRWHHNDIVISPAEFIPLLEKSGLIQEVGQWVLTQACKQIRLWHESGIRDIRVAVNVSARQLESEDFVKAVLQAIEQYKIPPACLELELTETSLIANLDLTSQVLKQFGEIGVRVAVDDFGTGYSSLVYLKSLPVHCLKIDQSFIADIGIKAEAEAISLAVINLAQALGLQVIAEGVETKEQLEFLRDAGCDEAQGYFFGRPNPSSVLTNLYMKSHASKFPVQKSEDKA